MSNLVERLRGVYRTPITDGLGSVGSGNEPDNPDEFVRTFPVPPIHREAAAEIERLTAERDAARAKVAQYEQAPVVGWKIEDWQQIYGIAGYRYLTSKQASVPREHWEGGEYDAFVSAMNAAIPLIARPEVTK